MTYKEAISLFRLKYRRYAEKNVYELSNDEILAELSIVQADLQNKYYLSVKSSADNSTAQTTLTALTDVYIAGTTAGTIPNDLLQVYEVYLNDSMKTRLLPVAISKIRDTVKTTAKPYRYAVYKQNSAMTLELDTYPDTAYTLTIIYVPRYELYHGSQGSNTNTTWNDLDYTASGYGGSLKLPSEWDSAIVEGALANVLNDIALKEKWIYDINILRQNRPIHFSGDIPYNDGTINRKYKVIPVGTDLPYGWEVDDWRV